MTSPRTGGRYGWVGTGPAYLTEGTAMPTTRPCLWFDTQSQEAAEFYVSVFPNSSITTVTALPGGLRRPGRPGAHGRLRARRLTVPRPRRRARLHLLRGGVVRDPCADQSEIDHYWDALSADGGETGPCGWLKDRFGLSWQVVPADWDRLYDEDEPEKAAKVFAAMMQMSKLDIAALQAARDS